MLLVYSWPGNVRELESVLIQAGIDAQGRAITDKALGAAILAVGIGTAPRLTESARLPELPPRAPQEVRPEPHARARRQERSRHTPSEAERLETAKLVHPLGPIALRLAQERGRIQRADLLDATGTSERTADRVLLGLTEAGVLVRDGRAGKAGGYIVGPHFSLPTGTLP